MNVNNYNELGISAIHNPKFVDKNFYPLKRRYRDYTTAFKKPFLKKKSQFPDPTTSGESLDAANAMDLVEEEEKAGEIAGQLNVEDGSRSLGGS